MFKKRRPYKRYFLVLIFIVFMASVWLLDMQIRKTLYKMAEVRAVQMATEAINNAVRTEIAREGMLYGDLVDVHKDSGGKIVLIQANTARINKISSETTLAVQSALIRLGEERLYIPIGQITGIAFLSNTGPRFRVEVVPMGTVRVSIDDRFEQAGINQTRHSIYLNFDTDVTIVIPLKSGRASVATQVPVAESIIIGDVPSTFVSLPDGLFGKGITR
ncbi:MAG: sporulation protein YunB [Bacillota bacterium]